MSSPSPRQTAYATELRDGIREHLTWTIDRDTLVRSFLPEPDRELNAQANAARKAGNIEEARALRKRANALQLDQAHNALDAYLARRQELADTDIDTMDAAQISTYITAAKAAFL